MVIETVECATASLLQRIADKDKPALRELHEMHGKKLFAELLRMLETRVRAKAAYLELMPRIWRFASEFDALAEDALDWLLRRARCVAIAILRKEGGDGPFFGRNIMWQPDTDLPAQEQQLRHHQVGRINLALRSLPVRSAELVVAKFVYGLTLCDLASIYNEPAQVVGRKVRAAGVQLRDQLLGVPC